MACCSAQAGAALGPIEVETRRPFPDRFFAPRKLMVARIFARCPRRSGRASWFSARQSRPGGPAGRSACVAAGPEFERLKCISPKSRRWRSALAAPACLAEPYLSSAAGPPSSELRIPRKHSFGRHPNPPFCALFTDPQLGVESPHGEAPGTRDAAPDNVCAPRTPRRHLLPPPGQHGKIPSSPLPSTRDGAGGGLRRPPPDAPTPPSTP